MSGPTLYAYVGNDPLNKIDPSGLADLWSPGCYTGDFCEMTGDGYTGGGNSGGVILLPDGGGGVIFVGGYVDGSANTGPPGEGLGLCPAPPITADEAKDAKEGDRADFWKSRASRGDPIAGTALDILNHENFGGNFANQKLVAGILFRSPGTTPANVISEVRVIGVELMRTHADVVNRSNGSLSATDIANYHFDVFASHGLPRSTFGGTPLTGTATEAQLTSFIWFGCQ